MAEQRYTAWNGEAMTFDELVDELGNYIAHLIKQCTPYEFVSDSKQEALLKLWVHLQDDPDWIAHRGFKGKGGLARRLAYDGRQQHSAWGPVQRLYEERVANESTLDDWMSDDLEDDDPDIAESRMATGKTDFWRDVSEMEPRNLDIILYPNGHHSEWPDLADMRLDLHQAINYVFDQFAPAWHERTLWAIMSLVYGVTISQAAFMVGVTRPAMNAHVCRCRKLMREKLTPYVNQL